ncbi:MAG: hypothetical protein DID90_2727554453 [Candidatus Nitrotoga sp. LAW]|nr:MAG: hypothetical protein DID90_2727554453 [Candidatus Nitrotoga sp. LAW]
MLLKLIFPLGKMLVSVVTQQRGTKAHMLISANLYAGTVR